MHGGYKRQVSGHTRTIIGAKRPNSCILIKVFNFYYNSLLKLSEIRCLQVRTAKLILEL